MSWDMNSGYSGFSMSKRAVEAYENGEKPLSKWTKSDILWEIKNWIADGGELGCSFDKLKTAKVGLLKDLCLHYSSWHHTSSHANATDFYEMDFDFLEKLTDEELDRRIELRAASEKEKKDEPNPCYRGNIYYLEWGGTRKHPKATDCCLMDVNIEERGCFYIVTDDSGKQLLRKKMDSNGTRVEKCQKETGTN